MSHRFTQACKGKKNKDTISRSQVEDKDRLDYFLINFAVNYPNLALKVISALTL